jgi:RNA:NAD 2'-phosphotransferase (TPT1/KptA family)
MEARYLSNRIIMNINKNKNKEDSKYLSYILRHSPQTIKLNIDEHGWAELRGVFLIL